MVKDCTWWPLTQTRAQTSPPFAVSMVALNRLVNLRQRWRSCYNVRHNRLPLKPIHSFTSSLPKLIATKHGYPLQSLVML